MFGWNLTAVAVVLLCGLSSAARGAGPDLSTPKKAAVEFAKCLETGDLARARAISMGTDEQFKLVEIISGLVRSARDLRSAAIERYGEAGHQILPDGDDLAEFARRVDAGTEKITGDSATVGQPNEQDPMKLKKTAEGTWQVDLASIPEKDQITKMLPKIQKIFRTGAADIKAEKYKTLEDAKNALSEQMFSVIAPPPTSQPVGPATR